MHPVDALLENARRLLGNLTPAELTAITPTAPAHTPSTWSGQAADTALTASDQLAVQRTQLHHTHDAARTVITSAAEISRDAHTQLGAIETAWATDKAAVGPFAHTPAGQAALLQAGQLRVQEATTVVQGAAERFQSAAGELTSLTGQLPENGPGSSGRGEDAAPLGFGPHPKSPAPEDPPHGKDPRYWLDVDKIITVPDGKLAPYGYMQVGPNLYYPNPDYPPGASPAPAKLPLDVDDLTRVAPGGLGPYNSRELAPGWFTPLEPSSSAPTKPVDVRDIIQVPPGGLAPYGYVEYLPGWFAPGPSNTPTIPTMPRGASR